MQLILVVFYLTTSHFLSHWKQTSLLFQIVSQCLLICCGVLIGQESHLLVLRSIAQWSLCISPPYHLKSCNAHCPPVLLIVLYLIPGSHLISTLLTCALACFPTRSVSTTRRRLVGWTQSVNRLKESLMFWYKIWEESGCPSSGILWKM